MIDGEGYAAVAATAMAGMVLRNAALSGDVEAVRRALAAGADPMAKNLDGLTALSLAADAGMAECVAILLPLSDAGSRDKEGMTALMFAAEYGSGSCVRLLLPKSDPRAVDKRGRSALIFAAKRGYLECLRMLLPVSDPELADNEGWTPLYHAEMGGHDEGRGEIAGWIRARKEKAALDRVTTDVTGHERKRRL